MGRKQAVYEMQTTMHIMQLQMMAHKKHQVALGHMVSNPACSCHQVGDSQRGNSPLDLLALSTKFSSECLAWRHQC